MICQMRRLAAVIAVFLALATPVRADDNSDANRLFVEAMQAWKQAEAMQVDSLKQAETRLELLQAIEANLNRIVDHHSRSDLAVQLMLGSVGPLNLDTLPALIEEAEELMMSVLVWEQILAGDIHNAQRGLAHMAILDAQTIEDADLRSSRLSEIAEAQAAAGDVSGALETAQTIEIADRRCRALRGIVEAQGAAGDVSGALETAQMHEDAGDRSLALSEIAEAQAAAGDVSGAQETLVLALEAVQTIEYAAERSFALREILESSVALVKP